MKLKATLLALAMTSSLALAQSTTKTEKSTTVTPGGTETTTTTSTTTGSGTITEFEPGKTIVLKESAGPRHYVFGKKVVYVTKAGKAIPEAEVKTRIRVGEPVSVQYVKEGDTMTVSRVVVGD